MVQANRSSFVKHFWGFNSSLLCNYYTEVKGERSGVSLFDKH